MIRFILAAAALAIASPACAITAEQEEMVKVCDALGVAATIAYAARDIDMTQGEIVAYILGGSSGQIATELVEKVVDSVFELPQNEPLDVAIYRMRAHQHHVVTECFDTAIKMVVTQ